MNVCIFGLGYVGLPVSCIIADSGHKVFGYDKNHDLVDRLINGVSLMHEPGLDSLLKRSVSSGNLTPVHHPQSSDVFIICVPTPVGENNQPDISMVMEAIDTISSIIEEGNIIIIESTVPVGTSSKIRNVLLSKRPDIRSSHLHIAHCPERVLPGNAISEIKNNDRVIGGSTKFATDLVADFYSTFCDGNIIATSDKVAELTKLAENTFRDINIAFANELSMVCAEESIDVHEVIRIANMHPRVSIHNPGIGVGGHCIPVDPWFIASSYPSVTRLIQSARHVNLAKETSVTDQIISKFNSGSFNGLILSGLSYKPNVDDFRESPALRIAKRLCDIYQGKVTLVEPFWKETDHNLFNSQILESIPLEDGNLIVNLVCHDVFKPAYQKLADNFTSEVISWDATV